MPKSGRMSSDIISSPRRAATRSTRWIRRRSPAHCRAMWRRFNSRVHLRVIWGRHKSLTWTRTPFIGRSQLHPMVSIICPPRRRWHGSKSGSGCSVGDTGKDLSGGRIERQFFRAFSAPTWADEKRLRCPRVIDPIFVPLAPATRKSPAAWPELTARTSRDTKPAPSWSEQSPGLVE